MMTILVVLLLWSVRAMIFALGLRTTHDDLLYLWRRPGLLVRSLFAMYVILPVAAVAMVKLLDLPRTTEVALLVLAISAGAPLVPRRLLELGGDPPYVLSLAVTSSLLAIVSVPVSVAVLSAIFGVSAGVNPMAVGWVVAKSFLLPLLAGVVVRRAAPDLARRILAPVTNAAAVVFTACALVAFVVSVWLVVQSGLRSFLALGALTAVGILAGHLLGGPKLEDRAVLGVLCATRHIGLAMVIAARLPSRVTTAVLCAYLVAAILVSAPYVAWIQRRLASGPRRPELEIAART